MLPGPGSTPRRAGGQETKTAPALVEHLRGRTASHVHATPAHTQPAPRCRLPLALHWSRGHTITPALGGTEPGLPTGGAIRGSRAHIEAQLRFDRGSSSRRHQREARRGALFTARAVTPAIALSTCRSLCRVRCEAAAAQQQQRQQQHLTPSCSRHATRRPGRRRGRCLQPGRPGGRNLVLHGRAVNDCVPGPVPGRCGRPTHPPILPRHP